MMVYPRQKIYGYSFYRHLKNNFYKKKNNNNISYIKKHFNLSDKHRINFVYKARIGFFHILNFLKKKIQKKRKFFYLLLLFLI